MPIKNAIKKCYKEYEWKDTKNKNIKISKY